uniref:Uncharacterized protein n=1 Tax=Anguilla anguilla TaxID=7936 RepID=A0A0E9SR35_ANGAN
MCQGIREFVCMQYGGGGGGGAKCITANNIISITRCII